jgi:hypothetical protein
MCSESREEVTTPLERICHPAFQLKYQIESSPETAGNWNGQRDFFFLRDCMKEHDVLGKGKKDKGKVAN